jgi:hypothetical protein
MFGKSKCIIIYNFFFQKNFFLRLLLRVSELLLKGNYVNRWEEAKRIWPEHFGSVNMAGFKILSNKSKSPPKGTILVEA